MRRIQKRQPLHPGIILKYHYLEPLSLSITKLAEYLGVSRVIVYKIVKGLAPVTPDLALRLSKTLKTTPGLWINLQKKYDLWNAEHESNDWQKAQPIKMQDLVQV